MSDTEPPAPRRFVFKPKEFERVNALPGEQPSSPDHDVYAIRRQLREREQAAGLDELAPRPPKRSRRRRDYWLIMLSSNVGFGSIALIGRHNPMVFVSGIAGVIILSVSLTWVMWFIMDDY